MYTAIRCKIGFDDLQIWQSSNSEINEKRLFIAAVSRILKRYPNFAVGYLKSFPESCHSLATASVDIDYVFDKLVVVIVLIFVKFVPNINRITL